MNDVTPKDNGDGTPSLNWKVREYTGAPVYLLDDKSRMIEEPLTYKSALKPGMEIAIPGLSGHFKATVSEGCSQWDAGDSYGLLAFDKDDRHCWISECVIKKGITRARVTTDE